MKPAATPELLAPAGNLETALAAYDAGADAVYCGLGKSNARERAQNFTPDSLARLLDYAHGRGRKLYLTLNTLVKETELSEVAAYLAELAKLRPDALIVQDLGVLNLVREYFPSLVLHASTQMGIHNSAGVAAAAGYLAEMSNTTLKIPIWNCSMVYFIRKKNGKIEYVASGVDFIPIKDVTNNFKEPMVGAQKEN